LQLYDTGYDLEDQAREPASAQPCSCEHPIALVDERGEGRCVECDREMPAPIRTWRGVSYFADELPPAA
jgi:hypothetical protein